VENLLRQDLTAVEEAEALNRLMTEQNYTQEQLGAIIGKARTTVTDWPC
jgi:ParB family chromosome partitioning protein